MELSSSSWERVRNSLARRRRTWEWGWDDLVKRVAREVVDRRQFGPLGVETLPSKMKITLYVSSASVSAVEQFIHDPTFLPCVEAELLNRLDRTPHYGLPTLEIQAEVSGEDGLEVHEAAIRAPALLRLRSDPRSGYGREPRDYPLPGDRLELTMGRGAWHGPNDLVRNDVQLPAEARFVSRRAAILRRAGCRLHVSARDQGRFLIVDWRGHQTRPDRAAMDSVEVGVGGSITLTGVDPSQRLVLEVLDGRAER